MCGGGAGAYPAGVPATLTAADPTAADADAAARTAAMTRAGGTDVADDGGAAANLLETSVAADVPDAADRSERGRPTALELARICTEFRGRDVRVLDLSAVTPHFDYFVLATGTSRRQMVALAEEADVRMKRSGAKKLGGEGDDGGLWIVRDYGDAVLHVFTEDARDTYDLEGLWGDAARVDWRSALGLPPESDAPGPSLAVTGDEPADQDAPAAPPADDEPPAAA